MKGLCAVSLLIIVLAVTEQSEVNTEKSLNNQKIISCENYDFLDHPIATNNSRVRKCCGDSENLLYSTDNGTSYKCGDLTYDFNVKSTSISLYDGCISFNGTGPQLPVVVEGAHSLCIHLSENYGSYLLQNGSVLIASTFGYFSYKVHDSYCIDMSAQNGEPMVCIGPLEEVTSNSGHQIITTSITLLSILCLMVVGVLHFLRKNFRTLHGLCVGVLLLCFSIELTLQCVRLLLCDDVAESLRGPVQYFTLVRCFWILTTFLNIVLATWLYIPCNIVQWEPYKIILFAIYTLICMLIPVFINLQVDEHGITRFCEIVSSPYSITIYVCIILTVIAYLGIRRLDNVGAYVASCYKPVKSMRTYVFIQVVEEAGRNVTCLFILIIVMLVTRILNAVALWFPSYDSLLLWNNLLISLQGVFFAVTFLILHPKTDFD